MSRRAGGPDIGERFFCASLRLYPRRFREHFGEDMVAFFRARRRESRYRAGVRGSIRLWLHLVTDIALSAPVERVRALLSASAADTVPHATSAADVPWASPFYPEGDDSMDALRQDLRYGIRTLLRSTGFAAAAVLTLALGIGANTAIFSVVNAVLLRPLPWPDPDKLVFVWGTRGPDRQNGVVYLDYLDWRAQTKSFEALGVVRGQSVNLTGGDRPERLVGTFATANVFAILGAFPAKGRLFTESETEVATKQPVAVISNAVWRTRLGSRPDVLGSVLVLNGQPFTVVGVLPSDFVAPLGTPDVWMPIGYYPNKGDLELRGQSGVLVIGRLKTGVGPRQAQADLDLVTRRLATLYPATNAALGANVQPLRDLIVGPVRTPLLIVLVAVAVVLLIACANVANLQLARAAARRRELSLRAALGAARGRLVRQLLTESLVVALAGGVLGIGLARLGVRGLATVVSGNLPTYGQIALEPAVLLFGLAITLAAGILFGSAPAWQLSRADLHNALTLRGDSATTVRLGVRHALVVAQIALCVVLLVSAGLLTRSLVALSRVQPGFDPTHAMTLQFRLPAAKYKTEPQIAEMFTRALAEIRAVPGVDAAALVRATPLNGNGETFPYTVEGKRIADERSAPTLQLNVVSTGYFETLRIPRLAGRDFTMEDRLGATPVAIVNEQLARRAWPGESPIGKRIQVVGADTAWATVVGVVATTKHFALGEAPLDQAYVPYMQRPLIFTEAVVRATGDPTALANAVRGAIWRVDRDQPVWRVRTMDRVLEEARGGPKLTVWVMSAFGALALVLAAIGVYGVMSYTVARRTQEVGIRMALGAHRAQVLSMVLRQGMVTIVVAIALGLGVALAATRLLTTQLYGVSATDPFTFFAVPILLGLVALLACLVPAFRASRVDPLVAMRAD
jgi:putative ABC transport system permease protein